MKNNYITPSAKEESGGMREMWLRRLNFSPAQSSFFLLNNHEPSESEWMVGDGKTNYPHNNQMLFYVSYWKIMFTDSVTMVKKISNNLHPPLLLYY